MFDSETARKLLTFKGRSLAASSISSRIKYSGSEGRAEREGRCDCLQSWGGWISDSILFSIYFVTQPSIRGWSYELSHLNLLGRWDCRFQSWWSSTRYTHLAFCPTRMRTTAAKHHTLDVNFVLIADTARPALEALVEIMDALRSSMHR